MVALFDFMPRPPALDRVAADTASVDESGFSLFRTAGVVLARRSFEPCERTLTEGLFVEQQPDLLKGHELTEIFLNPYLVQATKVLAEFQHHGARLCNLEQHALDVGVAAIFPPKQTALVESDGLKARQFASHRVRQP